jgi:hypothetical protein
LLTYELHTVKMTGQSVFTPLFTFRDNDNSIDRGIEMLDQNESIKTAILLANKLVQNREAAYQLYAPTLKLFSSSLTDNEIYGFLDEMISIGCDVDVETSNTMGDSYMTCIMDGARPLISFNETYIRDSSERNCFLHFVKIIHEYGQILTPKVIKHIYSQQSDNTVSNFHIETTSKVGMIWSASLGKEIGDCGSAIEESLFGGHVNVTTFTAKYFSYPLRLHARHYKNLCLGEGNTKTFVISDQFISQVLNQLKAWTAGTPIPNLEVPQVELIGGHFAETEQEAIKSMCRKRKLTEEYSDLDDYMLVNIGLTLSAKQTRLHQDGKRF